MLSPSNLHHHFINNDFIFTVIPFNIKLLPDQHFNFTMFTLAVKWNGFQKINNLSIANFIQSVDYLIEYRQIVIFFQIVKQRFLNSFQNDFKHFFFHSQYLFLHHFFIEWWFSLSYVIIIA
nr:MAG TPA: hypothetical protein [Herelleviridae sp.]